MAEGVVTKKTWRNLTRNGLSLVVRFYNRYYSSLSLKLPHIVGGSLKH